VGVIVRDLEWAISQPLDNLCLFHVKQLGTGMGLALSDKSKERLVQRIRFLHTNRFNIGNLKVSERHSSWFKKSRRPPVPSDDFGPFKFLPKPTPEFEFDQKTVFLRFATEKNWHEFQEDGHTIVNNQFDWIVKNPTLMQMIREEIRMYTYHRRRINDKANYGWVRSSYHSIAQQAIRQDPVYYALVCAARLDKNHWQISFPYYMKGVMPGDNIFF
jgi:hypothetical protein